MATNRRTVFEQMIPVLLALLAVGFGMPAIGVDTVLPLALDVHPSGEKGEPVAPARASIVARGVAGLGRRWDIVVGLVVGHGEPDARKFLVHQTDCQSM